MLCLKILVIYNLEVIIREHFILKRTFCCSKDGSYTLPQTTGPLSGFSGVVAVSQI